MNVLHVIAAFILVSEMFGMNAIFENGTQCLSRFDFDYKVLQKLVELERGLRDAIDTNVQQEKVIEQMKTTYRDDIDALKKDVTVLVSTVSLGGTSSTYVRWGRTTCYSGNGTDTVYDGFAGGSNHAHTGAAVTTLCLPSQPLWGKFDDTAQARAMVYGVEYEFPDPVAQKYFGKDLVDGDVPCALCQTVRSSVVMIPGRNACYDGWTVEYSGYLVGGHHTHPAGSEFVCLDNRPEALQGGYANHNGNVIYMTEVKCGSLKCPPYVDGRELTCVVCSK